MTAALDHGDDTALHTARKAAKRLRYATEVTGTRPKGLKELQNALGDHQDTVVARPVLRELGAVARTNGFSFGLLLGRADARAAAIEAELPALWRRRPQEPGGDVPRSDRGRRPPRPGRRPAPHRVPAGARARVDLPGARVPRGDRRPAPPRPRRGRPDRGVGRAEAAQGRRRGDGPLRRRVAARGGAGLPATAGGRGARRRSTPPTEELRTALRGDCHSHTDASDGGSPAATRWRRRPRGLGPRVPGGHRPLAAADRRQRAVGRAPAGPARRRSRSSTPPLGAGVPGAHRHRGRHQRGRLARPGARAARRARRRRRVGALQAADAARGDDRADADGHREPARRRARPLHGPDGHGQPQAPASRSSTPTPCSPPARSTASPSRSTPGRSGSTRPSGCCARRSRPAASFTIDTDAHAPGQLDWLRNGCERAVACGVPADRVLNTWPVDKLLAATRSGG